MILAIDNIANRYGQLPSHVLANASTFDLYVSDIQMRYQNRQNKIANGVKDPVPQLSQEQMIDMVRSVKERKNARR
jgi:hypothetical protein